MLFTCLERFPHIRVGYLGFGSVEGLGFSLALVVGDVCSSLYYPLDSTDLGDWKYSVAQIVELFFA